MTEVHQVCCGSALADLDLADWRSLGPGSVAEAGDEAEATGGCVGRDADADRVRDQLADHPLAGRCRLAGGRAPALGDRSASLQPLDAEPALEVGCRVVGRLP